MKQGVPWNDSQWDEQRQRPLPGAVDHWARAELDSNKRRVISTPKCSMILRDDGGVVLVPMFANYVQAVSEQNRHCRIP